MQYVKGLTEVESSIGQLGRSRSGCSITLARFESIRECHLTEELREDRVISRFDLVLESQRDNPPRRLRVIFHGAQALRLDGVFVGCATSGLEITDISSRQWEKLSWELRDFEESTIHCYAEEVEILLEPGEPSKGVDTGNSKET